MLDNAPEIHLNQSKSGDYTMNDSLSAQELQELSVELNQLDAEFEELNELFDGQLSGLSSEQSEGLDQLDAALEGSGISEASAGPAELSLMEALDGNIDEQTLEALGWWPDSLNPLKILKKKVAKLIRKIVRLVKKYRKLAACAPKVTKAVVLFKAGKYTSALSAAYSAYRCIKSRL